MPTIDCGNWTGRRNRLPHISLPVGSWFLSLIQNPPLYAVLNGATKLEYDEALKRASAILLLVFFSFSLIGPEAFADNDSELPACCRRDGKHHCASMEPAHRQPSSAPAVKAVRQCMNFPKANAVRAFSSTILLNASQAFFASIVTHPAVHPQTEARQRVSFSRSRQKRGPPISLS